MRKWVLPEYVDDILPPEAEKIEGLRRLLLEHFRRHGYLLVQPPLIEHLESLLTGTGHDLDLETFKVVDQLSGRLLGLRADMTPQVARIDAHLLNRTTDAVTRLCYAGSVLRTVPSGPRETREVLQIGAEIYGHAGLESDLEVLRLLLSALGTLNIGPLHLDLGHVGVFRALARGATLNGSEGELFDALRAKDHPTIAALTDDAAEPWRAALRALPTLYGPANGVLTAARSRLPADADIVRSLDTLQSLASAIGREVDTLHIDLADLRGYHYHTGVMFEVYVPGDANAIARGGRYDHVGRAFGRARPATGFTLFVRQLAGRVPTPPQAKAILAPDSDDSALAQAIAVLRGAGEVVIVELRGASIDAVTTGAAAATIGADRRLIEDQGAWRVVPF